MIKRLARKLRHHLNKQKYIIDKKMSYLGRKRNVELFDGEYFRTSSLELVAYEIYKQGVQGQVAEVGVYQGEFAKVINIAFPDRRLYLFDTFEGFDDRDIGSEKSNTGIKVAQDFSKTSVELVLNKMKYRNNVVLKRGWFPESLGGLEEKFCFVSLDADLYQPTISGLQYFYPRLERGGHIFVHDFNNDEYPGIRKAVIEYCGEYRIGYFPLSDSCGSVVIAK